MILLFDTNILVDVVLQREPFLRNSARLLTLVEQGELRASVCATTLTTLFYVGSRVVGADVARVHIDSMLKILGVAPVNQAVLSQALALPFKDFEDAVLHEAARQAGCEAIITRNVRDFGSATLPVYTPEQFLRMHQMSLHEKAPRRYR